MNILFAGPIDAGQTSKMRMDALRRLGHTIIPFNSQTGWNEASWLSRRFQQQLAAGPVVQRINSDLLKAAGDKRIDLFWAEKQEYLFPETLRRLKLKGARLVHFTPDPYFALKWKRTPHSDACMPLYDWVLTSKKYEMDDYKKICKNVVYMPLGFADDVHRPLFPEGASHRLKYQSDVAFVGGWEPRRERVLESIVKETACDMKIWGYGWGHVSDGRWTLRRCLIISRLSKKLTLQVKGNEILRNAVQGSEIYADEYARALSGSKISIGFLRQDLCPDQHTTRTFEIPACGSMLLADRTDEHKEFFTEGKEADFFSSEAELIDKVKFYLSRDDLRQKIAAAGRARCLSAGYSYIERLEKVLGYMATSRAGSD